MTTAGMRDDHGTFAGGGTIGHLTVGAKATAAVETVDEGDAAHLSTDLSHRLRVIMDSGTFGATTTGSAVPTTGNAVYPLASAQDTVVLVSSAVLAASSAWTGSSVVSVAGYRKINIDVYYTTDATGGTGGFMLWYPRYSNKAGAAPVFGDDVWVVPTQGNDTRTVTTPSGTIASGEDSTLAPGFAYVVNERLAFRSLAAANDADVLRQRTTLDISGVKWLTIAYQEAGDGSNPGTVAVEISLSI